MKMTERIRKLREQSLNAENRISAERALLITEFYQSGMADAEPVPVQRALAFKYILEHKYICVNEGELIVGDRPRRLLRLIPKSVSTRYKISRY